MGTYIYKTLAKHVSTGAGDVHLAKYVTKVGCSDPSGRGGKEGAYLVALALEEHEAVYAVSTGPFWYDDYTIDQTPIGYLKKNGRRWMVTTITPTEGDHVVKELKENGRTARHEASHSYEILIKAQLVDGTYYIRSAINGVRKPTIEVKTEKLAKEAVDSLFQTAYESPALRNVG